MLKQFSSITISRCKFFFISVLICLSFLIHVAPNWKFSAKKICSELRRVCEWSHNANKLTSTSCYNFFLNSSPLPLRNKISLNALHQNYKGKVGFCFRIDVPFRLLTSPEWTWKIPSDWSQAWIFVRKKEPIRDEFYESIPSGGRTEYANWRHPSISDEIMRDCDKAITSSPHPQMYHLTCCFLNKLEQW